MKLSVDCFFKGVGSSIYPSFVPSIRTIALSSLTAFAVAGDNANRLTFCAWNDAI